MAIRIVSFLALVFVALSLVPSGAHLFALPNKMALTEAQYFVAQSVYRGWALFGFVLFPGLIISVVFAFMLRRDKIGFYLAAAACVCLAAVLAIFFAFTYPTNVATQNWTLEVNDWMLLRRQWEYSHAVNALLTFVAFLLIAAASVARR